MDWQFGGFANLKSNLAFSAYNFRNNQHKELFKASGNIPTGTPSIYNAEAIDFVTKKPLNWFFSNSCHSLSVHVALHQSRKTMMICRWGKQWEKADTLEVIR